MNALTWIIAIAFAYWWHFQRETPRERKYREEQQQKSAQWNKYNMSSQSNQPKNQSKEAKKESDWDNFDMDQFK